MQPSFVLLIRINITTLLFREDGGVDNGEVSQLKGNLGWGRRLVQSGNLGIRRAGVAQHRRQGRLEEVVNSDSPCSIN